MQKPEKGTYGELKNRKYQVKRLIPRRRQVK